MRRPWIARAALLAAMSAVPVAVWAGNEFLVAGGGTTVGTVLMALNGSNQAVGVSAANPLPVTAAAAGMRVQAGATKVIGVQFTRPSQTTAYAAGQAVCASTSVDCTGLVFAGAGRVAGAGGLIQSVQLIKSTTAITNASFSVQIYQAAPTITGIKDASTYSPTFADVTSGAFRATATCTSPTVNGDNAVYQCLLANPSGAIGYVSDASAQLYAMIQANAAYGPGNAEKYQVNLSLLQD